MKDLGQNIDKSQFNDGSSRAEMPIRMLFRSFWLARWLISSITVLFFALAFVYAVFLKPHIYLATSLVGPIDPLSGGGSVRQAVAAYTGLDLEGMSPGGFTKFTQLLHSARLAAVLQKKYGLEELAFPGEWDETTHQWKSPSGPLAELKGAFKSMLGLSPSSPPTATAFATFLSKVITVQRVAGESPLELKNQTTEISVRLRNREQALRLLQLAIKEADDICRQDQLTNTQNRISYLTKLINQTHEVILLQGLQQILAGEEQTLVTIRASRYYSFDMIDTPNADTVPAGTPISMIIIASSIIGVLIGLITVFLLFRRRFIAALEYGGDPLAKPFPNPLGATMQWMSKPFDRSRRRVLT